MEKYSCKELNCHNEICKETYLYGQGRCYFCANKGIRNGNYIDNRANEKYYCKDCGEEIGITSAIYGLGMCKFCGQTQRIKYPRGKHHTEETKRKISLAEGGTGIPYENAEYPQNFTHKLKLKIRKRDNYRCQKCNITEEEHIIVYGQVLSIHHIDYDKHNCDENNLITLCNECNIRANYNRDYWQEYFGIKILASLGK